MARKNLLKKFRRSGFKKLSGLGRVAPLGTPRRTAVVSKGQRRLGLTAGLLYVGNTAGAAMGALSVPFLLLPGMGVQTTVWLCVAGNLSVALAAWFLDRR